MDRQFGTRRCATWDEIEEAPQIKRLREDKEQQVSAQQPSTVPAAAPPQAQQVQQAAVPEQPKFYISAPIQGFTVNNNGGCRYLFF